MQPIEVCIESGSKRVFASALAWPGWSRSASSEAAAIEALIAYGTRYAQVLGRRRLGFAAPETVRDLKVVERLPGDATTDFGAPSVPARWESGEVDGAELKRLLSILDACWGALDGALANAEGVQLRTGPRGGGRSAEKISAHVADAEGAFLRRIGGKPPISKGTTEQRAALVEALKRGVKEGVPDTGPRGGRMWPPRYFVRRTAWHVLDHAWEVEDRTGS